MLLLDSLRIILPQSCSRPLHAMKSHVHLLPYSLQMSDGTFNKLAVVKAPGRWLYLPLLISRQVQEGHRLHQGQMTSVVSLSVQSEYLGQGVGA